MGGDERAVFGVGRYEYLHGRYVHAIAHIYADPKVDKTEDGLGRMADGLLTLPTLGIYRTRLRREGGFHCLWSISATSAGVERRKIARNVMLTLFGQ